MRRILLLALLILAGNLRSQVVINEYSGSNVSDHPDGYGLFSDWFELYNTTGGPIDLSGYFLSDRVTNPDKWQIPAGVIIPPNGFIKVYCNGYGTFAGGNLNPSFKLTQCKPETILLADPAGTVINSVTMVPTQPNHSRGRSTDGGSTWALFKNPTPGSGNAASFAYVDYTPRPTFNVQAGAYPSAQTITLSSPRPTATIKYTLDGTTPTLGSLTYSSPISVTNTTVIRAISFDSDTTYPTSFIETNTYFINEGHVLPLVSISGDQILTLLNGSAIFPHTTAEYFDITGTFRTEVTGTANEHGNDSWAYDQRGFDYISEDPYGINHGFTYKLFARKDRDEFQRLIFKPAANDNFSFQPGGAHIRDAFVHTLSHDADLHLDERTYEPCILYVNGQYWGVYEIREKVDDKDFTSYYYDQDEPNIHFLKTWGATWEEYGAPNALPDWNNNVLAYVNANPMSDPANYAHIDSIFNTMSLIDYFILNSYTVCMDWLNWNTAWWHGLDSNGDGRRWRYALWDMDATYGHYVNYTGIPDETPAADPCNPEGLGDIGGQGHVPLLDSLLTNDEFHQTYINRFIDLNNTALSCDNQLFLLDSLIGNIDPEMDRQISKWGGGTKTDWLNNVTTMRNFIIARCDSITEGLMDCYNLTGPYSVTYQTEPMGVGRIKVNTVWFEPSQLPFTGTYFGGIVTELNTEPVHPDYEFDHWELVDAVSPSTDDSAVSVTYSTSQVVTAVYKIPTVVLVPSAFSPNGDGINDYLQVFGKGIKTIDMRVYNRWGELIYQTKDADMPWDGTYKGQKCSPGVYAYAVEVTFLDETSQKVSGNTTLVR